MSKLNETTSKRIQQWRAAVGRTESMSADRLAELETHLTDSVHELTGIGLSESEAVTVAISRVGDVEQLACEYQKGDSTFLWANRVFWICIGYVLISLAQSLVDASVLLIQASLNSLLPSTCSLNWVTMPFMACLGWAVVFASLRLLVTRSEWFGIRLSVKRLIFVTLGVLAIASIFQIISQIQLMRWLETADVGQVMLVRGHLTFAAQMVVPVAFVGFAYWVRRRFAVRTVALQR